MSLACSQEPDCFMFHLEDRACSIGQLMRHGGVRRAALQLGYPSLDFFLEDVRRYVEAAYLLATFCLTPPGDTPKRRGLHDAWQMGCVSVV